MKIIWIYGVFLILLSFNIGCLYIYVTHVTANI